MQRDSTRRLSTRLDGGDSAVIMDGWDQLTLPMMTDVPTSSSSREYQIQ